MKHLSMIAALIALCAGYANGSETPLAYTAAPGVPTIAGTPHPWNKPEDWTFNDCSKFDKSSFPPDKVDDSIKASYCLVTVEVEDDGKGGCLVNTSTPGIIFISPTTRRVFWRLRKADAANYQFQANGIVVRKYPTHFKSEPTDKTRRYFSMSRQASQNRVYAYDIQVERTADQKVCAGYGPLIINRD